MWLLLWGIACSGPAAPPAAPPTEPVVAPSAQVSALERAAEVARASEAARAADLSRRVDVGEGEASRAVGGTVVHDAEVLRPYRSARWLQGRASQGGLDVLVFWQPWCPACVSSMPKLQGVATRYAGRAEVVGLTTLSRGSSDARARDFLSKTAVAFPIAVIDGATQDRFGVRAYPTAVLLREGQEVWRGSPSGVSSALDRWLQ